MESLAITLPWPPSVNHYWEQRGAMRFLSRRALAFRREVKHLFWETKHPGFGGIERLSLTILLFPPDKRRRDVDNIIKSTSDSLQHAGVFEDDFQIDVLHVERMPDKLNKCEIIISVIC